MRIKLQKKTYTKNNRKYTSYQINIPKNIIESLGWDTTETLILKIDHTPQGIRLILENPEQTPGN